MRFLFLIFISTVMLVGCFEDISNSTDNSVGHIETDTNVTGGLIDTVNDGPLEQITHLSDFAAYVRVKGTPEVIVSEPPNSVPYTVVTFEVLQKGFGMFENSYGNNTFNVSYVEGCWPNGRCVAGSKNPKGFRDGDLAIVFVKEDHSPCGFTQCYNGVFRMKGEDIIAPNDSIVVFDKEGRARFIKGNPGNSRFKGLLGRSHLDTFMQRISSIADKASDRAKGMRKPIVSHIKGQPFLGSPSLHTPAEAPYNNEENESRQKARAEARLKGYAGMTSEEKWERQAYEENNKNPVLPGY